MNEITHKHTNHLAKATAPAWEGSSHRLPRAVLVQRYWTLENGMFSVESVIFRQLENRWTSTPREGFPFLPRSNRAYGVGS